VGKIRINKKDNKNPEKEEFQDSKNMYSPLLFPPAEAGQLFRLSGRLSLLLVSCTHPPAPLSTA